MKTMNVNGPGKYDEVCTLARELTQAQGAIVIIFGGSRGSGFSAQFTTAIAAGVDIPALLRNMADQIEGKKG